MVKCKYRKTERAKDFTKDLHCISICTCKNKIMAFCVTRLGCETMVIDNPLVCFDCDNRVE